MKATAILFAMAAIALLAVPAAADWEPGMPFKMHYPQLPDPMGWDVKFTDPIVLADDWRCTQTGPVDDVHNEDVALSMNFKACMLDCAARSCGVFNQDMEDSHTFAGDSADAIDIHNGLSQRLAHLRQCTWMVI